jgi:AraC-like DNA-binding protein
MKALVERNAQIVLLLIQGGSRCSEVARRFHISPDRVRQVFHRLTGKRPSQVAGYQHWKVRALTSEQVHEALRRGGTIRAAERLLCASHTTLRERFPAECAQWVAHWRDQRRCETKLRAATKLQQFFAQHGRAPSYRELGLQRGARRRPGLPCNLSRLFGGVPDAFRYAGIPQRPRGYNSHLTR